MPEMDNEQSLEELDEEQVKAAQDWQQTLRAFNSVFVGNPNGETVLTYLKNAFFQRTSLNEEGSAYKTIANEGKRFVILHIIALIEEGMS